MIAQQAKINMFRKINKINHKINNLIQMKKKFREIHLLILKKDLDQDQRADILLHLYLLMKKVKMIKNKNKFKI